MTHKYERQCWSCGGTDMDNMGTHVKCRSCGATWNEMPKLSLSPITEVDLDTDKAPRVHAPTRYKPRVVRPHGAQVTKKKGKSIS